MYACKGWSQTSKGTEYFTKQVNLNVESDDEFTKNINTIESQAINEIVNNLPQQSNPWTTLGYCNSRSQEKRTIT